ncbi:MAG: ATP-binding protein [Betaproteobacteria bacterium]|nr:ATP-binding protein [Betaproteobacteria bacterium]
MYRRAIGKTVCLRLAEAPRHIQILAGPRQVGKTTLIRQILADRDSTSATYISAESTSTPLEVGSQDFLASTTQSQAREITAAWLVDQWQRAAMAANTWMARRDSRGQQGTPYLLVVDEIQKVPNWSEAVKGLWDTNMGSPQPVHVLLLGSSPLLVQKGLSESLAGRFELIRMAHWSYEEMNDAFGLSLDQYIYFGGFPGSAAWIHDEKRWRNYVADSLVAPSIERDILHMTRVDQPALLKQLFEVGCSYSGQIVALDKVLGVLKSKGNTVTLSRYLDLLDMAGLLRGLLKYSDHEVRRRRSPPKFQVRNTALISATGGYSFDEARADRSYWGRLVESAVGAHLCNAADANMKVHYWREGGLEVDFVIGNGKRLAAVEVKTGSYPTTIPGLKEFSQRHRGCRTLVVGGEDLPVGEFLRYQPSHWLD